ncbi:cysteine desulfurase family protein [Apilactobacillus micheneri]|uniref:Cysteine desulfurase n=1 Tax=Apilactobacillus micheneri TaxID=1899430 RepID=A0A9Q8IP09_9LACO|nr:cysteine desulfurase family protein [Apilactobacillus micheneri]TPR40796.1 cysteine desulfurase [Apilactobacillus micheneri]TPR42263.1 cysteine desulfurase [Apilactobacillus micheneri]TPR44918.1 cysteine desulfurase [Apilactobacillus micheneri]TPR45217.1 cysteine desulfurase [Apilactobacillus micheneri]TPR46559.1 cysteine desulfurase [Apilactobacillus micheneri]
MKEIYLDNAATTKMDNEVLADMYDKFKNVYGNASTLYGIGRQAHTILENSRDIIAKSINAQSDEIIFTSGGTESDNTAIMQTVEARKNLGNHIITTAIEHEAVLKPLEFLEKKGFRVTYLPVDEDGQISLDDLKDALDDETILVTIMTGNNEVGSHLPIHEIGELLKNHQAWFHTDAVQAYGLSDIDVKADHIDMLSTSAHKLNGPKMMGFLYKNYDINFPSFIKGGDQEDKRRAGTENIPAISGFATAVSLTTPDLKQKLHDRYISFKNQIINQFNENNIEFEVNGSMSETNLQHVFNLWIKGVPTDLLQTNLDLDNIAVSSGSACTAGSIEPSHVLIAMYGKNSPRINQSIRVSFGKFTTMDDINKFIDSTIKIIKRIKK